MENMEGGAAAGREGIDAGLGRALDERRGASRTRSGAAYALCGMRRARQCDGRQRLRLLAEPTRRPRPPQHHVGKASRLRRWRNDSVKSGVDVGRCAPKAEVTSFEFPADEVPKCCRICWSWQILLQKSKVAGLGIFRDNARRELIATGD